MTKIEIYKDIGIWLRTFHNRSFFSSGLMKDFQHDVYLKVHDKEEINREYIKQVCKYYPFHAMRSLYAKRMKSFREFVPLIEGEPFLEFADFSTIPDFEFELPVRIINKHHRDTMQVSVLYKNGQVEEFASIKSLADSIQVKNYRTLYRYVGKPLSERFTKRKMSHIKLISYMISNPFTANPLKNIQNKMTRKQFDNYEFKDE